MSFCDGSSGTWIFWCCLKHTYTNTHIHTTTPTTTQPTWLNFSPPILEHFGPFFVQIAQMGLTLPRWGLILCRIPTPNPVLYSAVTHPFLGYVRTQTPPSSPRNTPFLGLNLKVGQMNYHLGQMDPTWAKCLKSGQNFSRSRQKKNIHPPNQPIILVHPVLWSE